MGVDDILSASIDYISRFSPLLLIVAAISVADLILDFTIKLLRKLPDFGFHSRRRRGP